MKVACLLALLCVAVVYEAEAGWWGTATSWIGGAAEAVVGMIGKKERKRRDLSQTADPATKKEMKTMCTEKHITALTPDGITFDIVKDVFEDVDKLNGKPNEALDEGEYDTFVNSLDVFKYCMTKGDKAKKP